MAVWELVRDAMQSAHERGREWLTTNGIVQQVHRVDPNAHPGTISCMVKAYCLNDPSKRNWRRLYWRNPLFVTDDPTKRHKGYRLLTQEERRAFLSSPRDDLERMSYEQVAQWLQSPSKTLEPEFSLPQAVARTPTRPRGRETTLRRMQERVDRLIADFGRYVEAFDKANPFTGPSWYFHHKTLAVLRQHGTACETLRSDEFFESLYATLTAWGLHRMGQRGAKLRELPEIMQTFRAQEEAIRNIQSLSITDMPIADLPAIVSKLWTILRALRVGAGKTKIVANSKALHHLLPDLVPPIDRAYTLRFFYDNTTLSKGDEVAFKEIYPFFHQMALACQKQIHDHLGRGPWNTSQTKVIDNAIVGFVLEHLRERRPPKRSPEHASYAIPDTGTGGFRARRREPGPRIGLIACTKAKSTKPAPARELYSASDLFRKAAAYCDAYLDGWFVLSAKYGLVDPDRIIAPYNMTLKTMSTSERRLWGIQVAQQLQQLGEVALEAHAGTAYVRPLLEAGVVLEEPLRGLAIGQRKRWYMERLP
jgi:hypothetical protein